MKNLTTSARKYVLLGLAFLISLCLLWLSILFKVKNDCYAMEEQIAESKSAITVQIRNRNDSILQLAQVIENSNKHELEVIGVVTKSRELINAGEASAATSNLLALVEDYPDLISKDEYLHLSQTIVIKNQQLANYRENYNRSVKDYRMYTRNPIIQALLKNSGYRTIDTSYLELDSEELPLSDW